MSRLEWRPAVRSPEKLRLHPALEELGWTGEIDGFNDAARLNLRKILDKNSFKEPNNFSQRFARNC